MRQTSFRARRIPPQALLPLFLLLVPAAAAHAGTSAAPVWSFVITTAPQLPQDVWFTGRGNNQDGWISAGVLCLGPLAQGISVTQHATLETKVIRAGLYGVEGTPVPPGTYTLPGGPAPSGRSGPAELWGPRDYTLAPGQTFFIIFEAHAVESNIPLVPQGSTLLAMFTFDFDPEDPASYGNTQRFIANWVDFTGTGDSFAPFLNEGLMMTNVRLQ
jgi:hypothetical protein